MSSILIILLVSRTPDTTVMLRCTRSAYPCAESQSSVVEALLAPSTLGVETTISWSARSSTPRIALYSSPVPESVRMIGYCRPRTSMTWR